MPEVERTEPEDFPVPTAVQILYRVSMTHWLATMPRSRAMRILQGMAEDLASEESLANVLLLRPPPEQEAVNRARRQAIALFRRLLPVWLAALDEEEAI